MSPAGAGLQRAVLPHLAPRAPANLGAVLRAPGEPLAADVRARYESRFGHDFSRIRVHADPTAAASARAVGALAYTVGTHVVVGDPAYRRSDDILVHELAHAVEQHRSGQQGVQRQTGQPPVSVRSPVFEELATQYSDVTAAAVGRPLNADERALLTPVFGTSVDYSRIRLIPSKTVPYTTVGNNIRVAPDFTVSDAYMAEVLVHETTHVWQYQHGGTAYISVSLAAQIGASMSTGSRNAAYDYTPDPAVSFFHFLPEQQALIVENYYSMLRDQGVPEAHSKGFRGNHMDARGQFFWLAWDKRQAEIKRELPVHEQYVKQMRQALRRTEADLLRLRASEVMQVPRQDLVPVPRERELAPVKPLISVSF